MRGPRTRRGSLWKVILPFVTTLFDVAGPDSLNRVITLVLPSLLWNTGNLGNSVLRGSWPESDRCSVANCIQGITLMVYFMREAHSERCANSPGGNQQVSRTGHPNDRVKGGGLVVNTTPALGRIVFQGCKMCIQRPRISSALAFASSCTMRSRKLRSTTYGEFQRVSMGNVPGVHRYLKCRLASTRNYCHRYSIQVLISIVSP